MSNIMDYDYKIKKCNKCCSDTLHNRTVEDPNWIMHLILAFLTGGLWTFVIIGMLIDGDKKHGPWKCGVCVLL